MISLCMLIRSMRYVGEDQAAHGKLAIVTRDRVCKDNEIAVVESAHQKDFLNLHLRRYTHRHTPKDPKLSRRQVTQVRIAGRCKDGHEKERQTTLKRQESNRKKAVERQFQRY